MIIYDYVIVGGGIAGLYAGYKLSETQDKILILEKNSYLGGKAKKIEFHGSQITIGAGIGRYTKDKLLKKLLGDLEIPFQKFVLKINWAFDNLNVKKIFHSLKSKYKKSNSHLTFKQYALTHLDKKTYNLLIRSIGLTDYENEDVEETLFYYGMEDNMDGMVGFGVDWNKLVSELVKAIKLDNKIKLNCSVNKINYLKDSIELITSQNKYYCKKLIIGCDISGIKKLLPEYSRLYSNIKTNSFIRIYAHFVSKHKKQMEQSVKTITYVNSHLYKIIPIDKSSGVYMIAYSDNKSANKLINLIDSTNDIKWLEQMLSKSLNLKEQIEINQISYFYWENGTHYFRPLSETVYNTREKYIKAIQNPRTNVYVCGEAVARSHGWVEGALESVEEII
jgi:hypothetical protein